MLAGLDGQEANEGDLEAGHRSEGIPRRVRDIEPGAVPSHADQHESMEGQQAGDEGVSSPRGHHVAVEEGAESAPKHGALLQSLNPEIEGEDQEKDGDGLVIVAASDRPGDVARGNTHERGGE